MRPKASLPPETSPARLLMGDYHLKLLSLLYLRPTEDFHLREVERLTGVPSGPANRELRRSCVIFDELAAILRKTTGLADVIRAALEPLQEKIELALLFGSSASGKEGPYSDIDLLVIGTVTFDEIVLALSNAQATLGRPINPVILKPREFSTKRDKGDAFLKRVLAEPKIVLLGSLDEPR
jgi:predicted nucleotidyltransferase